MQEVVLGIACLAMIKTISPVEGQKSLSYIQLPHRSETLLSPIMAQGSDAQRRAIKPTGSSQKFCCATFMLEFDQTADKWEEDLNRLHTALNAAVEAEDYTSASLLRDQISAISGFQADDRKKHSLDWKALGVPDWLVDRLERMGFRLPTQVQRNAMKAISQKAVFSSRDTVIRSPTG
ncbi:hypothetical protein GUITHDRAFT_107374 [Guillardia theta CCMP2712]|uniref:DEAD-box RNA helicase Q domain-containing protein n=1 Tax=Guillardia theta (strain CCMP2712) TaxID=905079 RepID=L1JE40_GUITC|nr:hypothetical protein GUITHDRAFT_107374 [Guillardia theta CCMP2712]EKX46587.1 hypothetical protein GUITHDRAFT_107374 [Guillardia theta CCMP2712]|eukprot:XP_005833567.1 hypothetical protein GUITHDRAFT_107374 [Guillardia theta CCMP2712]